MTSNIEVFKQNSIRIQSSAGVIYIDPFGLQKSSADADYILLTHNHYDHFSLEDIGKAASGKTILIAPENMRKNANEAKGIVSRIEFVKPSSEYDIEGLQFETVPSYNINKSFHMQPAGWVGYILKVDGERIYIAGDTDATAEAKQVKCDIALIPIGGTYTMDAAEAADLINTIKPRVAIPTHYGSIVGNPKDAKTFAAAVKPPVEVEIKIK